MKLLRPAFFVVELGEFVQAGRLIFQHILVSDALPRPDFQEDVVDFVFGVGRGIHGFQAVVGQAATARGKEIVAAAHGFQEFLPRGNVHIRHFRKPVQIRIVRPHVFNRHRPVGPESGVEGGKGSGFVMFQTIHRIVGGADGFHVEMREYLPHAELVAQQFGSFVVDVTGGFRFQQGCDAKRVFQFQVRPVVQRIAQRVRHGFGPFRKLFVIRRITRDETFVHAVGAHGPPLVMVAVEPDLRGVFKHAVLGYLAGRQVVVVVQDGHLLGIAVVECFGRFGLQQEIVVEKRFHGRTWIQVFTWVLSRASETRIQSTPIANRGEP